MDTSDKIALTALIVSAVVLIWTVGWSVFNYMKSKNDSEKIKDLKEQANRLQDKFNNEFKDFAQGFDDKFEKFGKMFIEVSKNSFRGELKQQRAEKELYESDNSASTAKEQKLFIKENSALKHVKNLKKERRNKW